MAEMRVIQIGKKGVTEAILADIKTALKTKGLIKVKVLKCIKHQYDQILTQILEDTNAELVERKGFTFILKRKK